MKAVIYRGIGQIAVEEVEKPQVHANEYLLEVQYSGLCGTDIKTYTQGHRMFKPPCVLGHEFSGRIVEAGAGADSALIGKMVVAAPYIGCGHCELCRSGFEELCSTWPRPGTDGSFAEYLTISADLARDGMLVLEDGADLKVMTLAEPLGCILNSMDKSQVRPQQKVLVIGTGPMGLLHIEGLKQRGVTDILALEYNKARSAIAKKMGALVIDPHQTPDVKGEIRRILKGGRLDHIFACVGLPSVVEDAVLLADKGSTVNIFGGLKSGSTITIDPNIIHYSEVKLVGTFGFNRRNFLEAAHMIASGQVDLSALITDIFPLEEADKAFELGAHPAENTVKILLQMK